MSSYMKKGQGTVGALIMDPTIYDQLVSVLGGVARSRILRRSGALRDLARRRARRGATRDRRAQRGPELNPPKE